ncbi:response regulator [Priestia megaterium]|nr:response regulator [Priestia megaterium]
MKVLIVDDEEHVREGIKLLGEWEENGIKEIIEADSGEQAIALMKNERPEIIFTDMKMPNVDGIALLEWIKQHSSASKTIVVTGYDDYHYMRKAIHFGSTDYILKPVDPSILNDTLKRAVSEWNKEEESRKQYNNSYQLINEMKPIYRDRKLTQLMNQYLLNQSIYEEFGFHLARQYEIAIIRVDEAIIQSFAGDRDLAYFSILNVANELLEEKENGVAFRYLSSKGEIIIIFWDQFDEVTGLLQRLNETIAKALDVHCRIAKGSIVSSIDQLMNSYTSAKQVLLLSNILDEKRVKVYTEADLLTQSPPLINMMDYNAQIEEAMQVGRVEAFLPIFDDLLLKVKEQKYLSLKQLIHFEKEYQLVSQHWFKKYHLPYGVRENYELVIANFYDEKGQFQLEQYMERKKREISRFLKIVKRYAKRSNRDVIYEIEHFLQSNFHRDVKLQEISERFYLSREYISRKFKQEFQENISDYMVKVRMNKAKSLLQNDELKIYEIANMIGYQDDKYFRKVFKKVEGITPNEYRNLSIQTQV